MDTESYKDYLISRINSEQEEAKEYKQKGDLIQTAMAFGSATAFQMALDKYNELDN